MLAVAMIFSPHTGQGILSGSAIVFLSVSIRTRNKKQQRHENGEDLRYPQAETAAHQRTGYIAIMEERR